MNIKNPKLASLMAARNMGPGSLARATGIPLTTMRRKLSNNSLTLGDIHLIACVLDITRDNIGEVFFSAGETLLMTSEEYFGLRSLFDKEVC